MNGITLFKNGEIIMNGKVRTTIYLDADIIHLARLEDANVSRIVNNILTEYFKTDNVEKLEQKAKDLEAELNSINKRIYDLIQKGISTDRKNNMNKNIYNELLNIFKKRIDNIGYHQANFEDWMHTPKNQERCKIIGKEPLEVLEMLKKEAGIDA